jgi:hypothetical protein
MVNNATKIAVEMRLAGHSNTEIASALGKSYTSTTNIITAARKAGLLPPIKRSPLPSRTKVSDELRRIGISRGTVGAMCLLLTKEQRFWLYTEARKIGCTTLSEYLAELVRDEYEQQGAKK